MCIRDRDCCREQTGKTKKFPLRLPKRPLFTVVVVNSGQNTPPQSLYWWSKPVYPQTRAAEESGSFLEQDSTTVPKLSLIHIYEGATVRAMEKKGIRTEKGEFNRWIKATNAVIRDIKKKITLLFDWIAEAKAELAKPQAPDLVSLLNAYYTCLLYTSRCV